jgi:hypothetical protein
MTAMALLFASQAERQLQNQNRVANSLFKLDQWNTLTIFEYPAL